MNLARDSTEEEAAKRETSIPLSLPLLGGLPRYGCLLPTRYSGQRTGVVGDVLDAGYDLPWGLRRPQQRHWACAAPEVLRDRV